MNRRALFRTVLTSALPVVTSGCCRSPERPGVPDLVYQGSAFGTEVSITIAGLDRAKSERLLSGAVAEMERLEAIFTLFDAQSPLRRLNSDGRLEQPPPELVEALRISAEVNQMTGGAFDPSVQPLWDLYENHFALRPGDQAGPPPEAIAEARARIGWEGVEVGTDRIEFAREGMAITLNGIAPGYAADRIADWLADRGVRHALIDAGEFRAIGSRPDSTPWLVGIRAGDDIADRIELIDRGLATSSGSGTTFDLAGQMHHLFNPQADQFSDAGRTISVEAPTAAVADALATAGGTMEPGDLRSLVAGDPQLRVREYQHGHGDRSGD